MLSATLNKRDITCHGDNDGVISYTATGGTGTIEASIDNTNYQTGDFTSLSAGTYTINFRDQNGCTTTASININEPTEIILANSELRDVICPGEATGDIITRFSGGTGTL